MIGPIPISEIKKLAPMPVSTVKLCTMISDPNTSIAQIARVVELDPALTANTLRMANSAWSSPRMPIVTVREAVVRLGTARILGLAVAKQVEGKMSKQIPGYQLGEHELWRHSVAAALTVFNLNKYVKKHIPSVAFTAALLHDIGKLLLARYLKPESIQKIQDKITNEKVTYLDAEREVIGTDHAEVGGVIAEYWQFPEELVTAIRCHHQILENPDIILDAVSIGNIVAKLVGVGLGSEQMNMKVDSELYIRLGLKINDLESLCARVKSELIEAEELFGSN